MVIVGMNVKIAAAAAATAAWSDSGACSHENFNLRRRDKCEEGTTGCAKSTLSKYASSLRARTSSDAT
jgi:hypothetical protein